MKDYRSCPACGGTGFHTGRRCGECRGAGRVYRAHVPADRVSGVLALARRGPKLFAMPSGFKKCPSRGPWTAMRLGENVCCPGCDRLCRLPDFEPGEQFKVIAE
jgi:hypothetical protein